MRAFPSLLLCCVFAWSGCTTTGAQRADNEAPHAECLVCKHEADLACLNVKITDQTPRSVYNGQTYYFCSQECKTKFDQQPTKYVEK